MSGSRGKGVLLVRKIKRFFFIRFRKMILSFFVFTNFTRFYPAPQFVQLWKLLSQRSCIPSLVKMTQNIQRRCRKCDERKSGRRRIGKAHFIIWRMCARYNPDHPPPSISARYQLQDLNKDIIRRQDIYYNGSIWLFDSAGISPGIFGHFPWQF